MYAIRSYYVWRFDKSALPESIPPGKNSDRVEKESNQEGQVNRSGTMNRYYTEVEVKNDGWKLGYEDKILFMGSCFTENIGEIMEQLKFQTLINPFGILYNPMSIAASLRRLMDLKQYKAEDLFEHNGVWGSFDFHGRYSASSVDEAVVKMNEQVRIGYEFLKTADCLILTFGTSWVYDLKQTGDLVANCHKFPAADFHRYRLSTGEIVSEFT